MKRSTLVMVLCLVLAVAMGVGSTMAYLQDTDEDVNVMTLGSVYIEQHEFERVTDENGDYTTEEIDGVDSYVLKDFTQGKPLYPFVGEVNNGYDKIPVRLSQLGHNSRGGMDVFPAKNVQDKFVVVENTGKSDAYVRTIVAFEAGENSYEEFRNLINYSYHFTWEENILPEVVEIDGNNYVLVEFLYKGYEDIQHPNGVLTPGDYAYNSLAQVYMYNTATNEDVESLDGNKNGTYDILVVSQAVQTQGFADAETALDTAFGDITVNNNPWKEDGKDLPGTPVFPVNASDADEMMAGLAEGADIIADKNLDGELIYESNAAIELDAKGATVQLNGSIYDGVTKTYSYLGFVPPKGEDVAVSNLNVTGAGFVELGHYGVGGGDYTATNVEIKDLSATFAVNNGGNDIAAAFSHYGNATLKDCVMTGTTTEAEGYKPYDAAFVNGTKTVIEGGEYGNVYLANQAYVTIKDAKIGTIDSNAITQEYKGKPLGDLTIAAGTTVGTITLTPGSYEPALVIDKDATVGQIIYNGTTYTQAQWMAR